MGNILNIPNPQPLPNTNDVMPFVFIGDEIFPLRRYFMKPFNRKALESVDKRIFNYWLSRARWTIECAFGILCAKWKIFNQPLAFDLKSTNTIVAACICLHNFIINTSGDVEIVDDVLLNCEAVETGDTGLEVRQNILNILTLLLEASLGNKNIFNKCKLQV